MAPRWTFLGGTLLCLPLIGLAGQGRAEDTLSLREQEARAISADFLKQLGGALQQELAMGGPEKAIRVCQDLAPRIASRHSLNKGWRVTRVGTRVRNPLLGMPDSWEQRVLADFDKRLKQGEDPQAITFGDVVDEADGRYYRFMRAIPVQSQCLMCHGLPSEIAPGVQRTLKTQYPHDRATGYRLGELRGAVSIKQPL